MQLSFPLPRTLTNLIHAGADQLIGTAGAVVGTAGALIAVPIRIMRVLAEVELLIARMTAATERAEALLLRTGNVVDAAEETVGQARVVAAAAALAVEEAAAVAAGATAAVVAAGRVAERADNAAAQAEELLTAYAPTLNKAAPMARRFVEQLSPDEVTAAIRLIDELPRLREHLNTDILPLLTTLQRVGPDVHALLDVTRDLKLAVTGIPGFRMLRRRGEDREADEAG